jgi:carbon storage regulator CsrA
MGLVLRRRQGEQIRIAGNIVVRVVRVRSGQVSLFIDAPRDVSVQREEIVGLPAAGSGDLARQMVEEVQ